MNLPFSNSGSAPNDPSSAYDARPIVAIRRRDRTVWWFAGGAALAAVLLFSALEARRRATSEANAGAIPVNSYAAPEAIPELVVPGAPAGQGDGLAADAFPSPEGTQQRVGPSISVSAPRGPVGQPRAELQPYTGNPYQDLPPPGPLMVSGEPALAGPPAAGFEGQPVSPRGATAGASKRVMAGRLENPATTVVQGTLINAVLETALDSTRPGQTRAVVTRDVYGFDGTRLLVPRGTRLYGVYEADVAQGQKRAQIRWTRLLRPDGASVALDSPAADPLGRAGIKGSVDSHFLQRFGNALLGTTANVSSALITRGIGTSPVVVAVPGGAQAATQPVTPSSNQITPTLTVRQGTRITVFVQHDLDFTSVEDGQ